MKSFIPAAILIVSISVSTAEAQHPFYDNLAREGAVALEREDWSTAAETLRVAAFGLLDEPALLAEALAGLAVAQAALEDPDGFTETLTRLVDLEERFGAYGDASLTPSLRTRFEAAALAHGPEVLLNAVPAFRPILERRQETTAAANGGDGSPSRRERRAARRAAEQAETAPAVPEVTDVEVVEVVEVAQAGGSPAESSASPGLTADEREVLDRSRATLAEASEPAQLREALVAVREVADRLPDHQEAQILAGEIAYRASRFEEAAHFFDRVGADRPNRPDLAFYMAVTWYETGQRERAAEVLEPSLPRLQRTPFVESWIRKIFGVAAEG